MIVSRNILVLAFLSTSWIKSQNPQEFTNTYNLKKKIQTSDIYTKIVIGIAIADASKYQSTE